MVIKWVYQDSLPTTSQNGKFSRFIMKREEAGLHWVKDFLFLGSRSEPFFLSHNVEISIGSLPQNALKPDHCKL